MGAMLTWKQESELESHDGKRDSMRSFSETQTQL